MRICYPLVFRSGKTREVFLHQCVDYMKGADDLISYVFYLTLLSFKTAPYPFKGSMTLASSLSTCENVDMFMTVAGSQESLRFWLM